METEKVKKGESSLLCKTAGKDLGFVFFFPK